MKVPGESNIRTTVVENNNQVTFSYSRSNAWQSVHEMVGVLRLAASQTFHNIAQLRSSNRISIESKDYLTLKWMN